MSGRGDGGLIRRGLKFAHLRLFAELAQSGQMTTAAAALAITQPAASRLAAEAERICGAALYERTARGVVLTPAGEALAARARRILREIGETGREIAELGSGAAGIVTIGAVTGPAVEHVMPVARRLRVSHPGIQLNVEVATSDVLVDGLADGALDFVIGRIPQGRDPRPFRVRSIGEEPVCLVARRGHPALRLKQRRLAELVRYDWVFPFKGTLLRQAVEETFAAHGVPYPNHVFSTSSLLLTLVALTQTNAVAPMARVVGEYHATARGAGEGLAILPCEEPLAVAPYALIVVADRPMTPATEIVHSVTEEQLGLVGR